MKDIYEVLRQKEHDRSRLEKEVEALRVAAPLLAGDEDKEARNAGNENEPTSPVSGLFCFRGLAFIRFGIDSDR